MYVAKSDQPGVFEQPEGYTHVDGASVGTPVAGALDGAAEIGADVGAADAGSLGADVDDVGDLDVALAGAAEIGADVGAADAGSLGADVDDVGDLDVALAGAAEIGADVGAADDETLGADTDGVCVVVAPEGASVADGEVVGSEVGASVARTTLQAGKVLHPLQSLQLVWRGQACDGEVPRRRARVCACVEGCVEGWMVCEGGSSRRSDAEARRWVKLRSEGASETHRYVVRPCNAIGAEQEEEENSHRVDARYENSAELYVFLT